MAWATARQRPVNKVANFFITSYGVKVEASRNMMVICRAADWRGTTLPDVAPESLGEDFRQLCLSIAVSKKILELLEKQKTKGLSEKMFLSDDEEEEEW
jgi:hypothetical protein